MTMRASSFTYLPRHRPLLVLLASLGLAGCDLGKGSIGNGPDDEADSSETDSDSTDSGDSDSGDSDSGDSAEDIDTGDTGMVEPGICGEESQSILTDFDAIPPGFESSVAEVLALAEGSYTGTFTWNQNDGPVSVTHAGTSSPLAMSIGYAGGEVRLTEVELVGQTPDVEGEPCSNRIEIDVNYEFATEDGVFAESGITTLQAESHAFEPGPSIDLELDLAALGGSLSASDFTVSDGILEKLELMIGFAQAPVTGALWVQIQVMDWVGFGSIAGFTATKEP